MKKETIIQAVVGLIVTSVLIGVGYMIFSQISLVPPYPHISFTILDKRTQEVPYSYMLPFWTYTSYQFQFTNSTYAWIEVEATDYAIYQIGDLYPNEYVIIH